MVSNMVKSIAQTNIATAAEIESGGYAPLLKFPKYNGASFNKNSRFIFRLLQSNSDLIKTSEIYITTGENYKTPSAPIVHCINMIVPEVEYVLNELDDCYILYVRSSNSGCLVYAQVLFCENVSFVEPYNFEQFSVNPDDLDKPVRTSNGYFSFQPAGTRSTGTDAGFYKIARMFAGYNTKGCTYAFSLCGKQNGDSEFIGGTVYVKVRNDNKTYPKVTLKTGGTTEDFNNTTINIIAKRLNDTMVEIYIHQIKNWNALQIKDEFWDYDKINSNIAIIEPEYFETLPSGDEIRLFN